MSRIARSEERFRNDEHISGFHQDVLIDLAAIQQISKLDLYLFLLAINPANNLRLVTRGRFRKPADFDQNIEQGKPFSKRY